MLRNLLKVAKPASCLMMSGLLAYSNKEKIINALSFNKVKGKWIPFYT